MDLAFFSRLLSLLYSDSGKVLVRTFLAKAISALGVLGLVAVVGRLYGPQGLGVFALAQSILIGAGIIARRGMDGALIRFVGRDHHAPQVGRYLLWAIKRSLFVSVPFALLLIAVRVAIGRFFSIPDLSAVLVGIGLAVPFYSCAFLLSAFFKGVRRPATAAFLENGSISLLTGLFVLIIGYGFGDLRLSLVGIAYMVSAFLVSLQGAGQALLWLRRQGNNQSGCVLVETERLEFDQASKAFFVMGLASFMQSVLSIMIAGKFLNSVDMGLFKSAQQIAISVGFVLLVINTIYPPRFAALYHRGEIEALGRVARNSALLGLVIASPFLLLCLLAPYWVLGWLGDGFQSAALLLRVMALGQLVSVATGSVGFLLNMTGHESTMKKIAISCSALGLLAFLVLTPLLGALGAALALAFVLVAQNLVAMFFVWLRLEIWTMPGPNWLLLLGIIGRGRSSSR